MKTLKSYIIRTDKPFNGTSESFTYIRDDGVECVAYTGFTLEEYKKDRNYPFKLVSGEELDKLMEDHEKTLITEPQQIKKKDYWYALEVLPPCRFNGNVFHVSERIRGDLVNWYFRKGEKYFTFVNRDNIADRELLSIMETA